MGWSSGMTEFKDLVLSLDLSDLCAMGHFLTWWDSNVSNPKFQLGIALSRDLLQTFCLGASQTIVQLLRLWVWILKEVLNHSSFLTICWSTRISLRW